MIRAILLATLPGLALANCESAPRGSSGEPPALVKASVETVVTTDPEVDADDPAFWADAADPSRALMFATDKTDGLYVHNMDGGVRQFIPSGALNNVDLRTGFKVDGRDRVLVGATADEKMGLFVYLMDPATLETREWSFISTGDWKPYGFCMAKVDGAFYLIANSKTGSIRVWTIAAGATGPAVSLVRELNVGSQPEGCVADDATGDLYVGEEDVGIWKFSLAAGAGDTPVSVAKVDGRRLTADVEGMSIMRDAGRKYLIVSSQGDNTYNVFRIDGAAPAYAGRFAIEDGPKIDGTSATDGVDAWSGPIGPFPEGVVGVHDDTDTPNPGQQNYKMVDWRDIRAALGLAK